MKDKKLILILIILGILYRLLLTWNGNFLFNMDNARDMGDVREIVVLHKARFTGPSAAVQGLFNGPAWYYFLAVPFSLSGGDPYASILTMIILWAIGGFFLLKLVSGYGKWITIAVGSIWITSNYVVLTNLYAFNPNPVILLTPLFVYLLKRYLETGKTIFSISTFLLAGLFFNFEMNAGVFMPVIILVTLVLAGKIKFLRSFGFWLGFAVFILTLLPQIIFDLKHQFIMTKSLINFLSENRGTSLNIANRLQILSETFFNSISATLFNHKNFTLIILILSTAVIIKKWKLLKKDLLFIICFCIIFIPFLGYMFLPVTVNAWHIGAEMAAVIILVGFLLREIWQFNIYGKLTTLIISLMIILFAFGNLLNFFVNDFGKKSADPSLYGNEIAAIEFVYKYAKGKNFKAYIYLPSVYDYPYQYLFWWYGKKTYGYLPEDYAYSPNKPQYIGSKEKFSTTYEDLKKRENSNLVFLIKEPNRNYTRFGWEGDFIKYNWQPIEKQMIGPLEIEIRKEISQRR